MKWSTRKMSRDSCKKEDRGISQSRAFQSKNNKQESRIETVVLLPRGNHLERGFPARLMIARAFSKVIMKPIMRVQAIGTTFQMPTGYFRM